jgi:endonuclease-3 related protein
VEKAIAALKIARLLNWKSLREVPIRRLAGLIRPAGYFNLKAKRLKNFVQWLWRRHNGQLDSLADMPTDELRAELLQINGVGPETADSILLYALDRPTFVIDAYTRRIAVRHHLMPAFDASYEKLKAVFENHVPRKTALFNEYHALIVAVGKRHCGPKAKCTGCPLEAFPNNPLAC